MSSSSSNHDTPPPNPSWGEASLPSDRVISEKCIGSSVINLSSSPAAPARTTLPDENPTLAKYGEIVKEFNDLTRKLGASVLISVFIASIITAFLSLANDVIRPKGNLEFEIAMFFSILAASCHISDVVVSGRAYILAYQYSRLRSIDHPMIEDYEKQLDAFTRCQRVSQWVQGLGQALFGVALLYTLWLMLKNRILTSSIYVFASILQIGVYVVGFWRISWAEDMIFPIVRWLLYLVGRRGTQEGV